MTAPWSPAELEAKIPELIDRLGDAVLELKGYGVRKAETLWAYRRAKAQALVTVKGPNADYRDAAALLHQIRPGLTVADLGLERDLAETAYWTQQTVISALQTDADLIRSMLVSSREQR